MTNDIIRRIHEHKTKEVSGFTKRYAVDRLVWFEIYDDPITAITREKELKKWRRDWKIRLIEETNPNGSIFTRKLRAEFSDKWIPGSRYARPGMTRGWACTSFTHQRVTAPSPAPRAGGCPCSGTHPGTHSSS
ncbi:GIY-YIG nuclease family protein [Bradyrhizobium sp. Leo121]|uniref:GIY-YIG nuclease family protein n=1 Tax=Bradyrhizobium sp. Leo121 TaxID=1571195 RepID=UPI001FE213C0|nr:GIY-YIG nuclease family protein [Bradyrhizobium sp. Leo121]